MMTMMMPIPKFGISQLAMLVTSDDNDNDNDKLNDQEDGDDEDNDDDNDNDDDDANAKVWHLTANNVGNLRLIPAQRIPQSQLANPLKAGHQCILYIVK